MTDEPYEEGWDEFIFDVRDVEEKYYLSDKAKKYVLTPGTKNFRTSTETDLDVARPLLQSMHKMHRAGVDNYVTHKGRIRKLTPRECLRLMGFKTPLILLSLTLPCISKQATALSWMSS